MIVQESTTAVFKPEPAPVASSPSPRAPPRGPAAQQAAHSPKSAVADNLDEDDAAPLRSEYQRVVTDDEPTYPNTCARTFVAILSGLLLASGMAIAILGRIEQDHKVLPVCPKCDTFIVVMYIAGSCVAVFGLLGLVAAKTRLKLVAFFYAFLMFLMAVLCFAAGCAVLVFDLGLKRSEVERMWTDAISDDARLVCDLQERLECSGFSVCCGIINVSQPITPPNTYCNITLAEYVRTCDSECTDANARFREPCDDKVTDLVKSHFKPLVGVTFGTSVLLFTVVVLSIRMTFSNVAARRSLNP